jgi:hypothetical protein
MLGALLAASAATVSSAVDDSCPSGEFETDLAEIRHSFVRPDTRLAQTSLASFGQVPAEIVRIRSGVTWSPIGGIFGLIADWKAYDAERHLFIQVNGGWSGNPPAFRVPRLSLQLAAGDRTYCMTIGAGTPEQAGEFACRVNRLGVEAARAAIEATAQRRTGQNQSGRGSEGKQKRFRIRDPRARVAPSDAEKRVCRCALSVRDEQSIKGGSGNPLVVLGGPCSLEGWIDNRLALSDRQLWRVLNPPHVIDIALTKRGDLYLLVDE